MTRLGIMQGRLSAPVGDRIQAFPVTEWREEFARAAVLGFNAIEWILETPLEENPLWTSRGVLDIKAQIANSGVTVDFVCADYFMEVPLVRMDASTRRNGADILSRLLDQAARLGVKGVELPFVDNASIGGVDAEAEVEDVLAPALERAASLGLVICLETDLPPPRFAALLRRINHRALRANYDTGNSASLGYDADEEMTAYGGWISNVHIKDRLRGAGTVPLGQGDANIPCVVKRLRAMGYAGEFTLQAARGTDDMATARDYRTQVLAWFDEVAAGAGFDCM